MSRVSQHVVSRGWQVPRLVASIGGLLVGVGMTLASGTISPMGYIVGIGLVASLALLAGKLYDWYQTFAYAYYGAATLLVIAAIVVFALRPPHIAHED